MVSFSTDCFCSSNGHVSTFKHLQACMNMCSYCVHVGARACAHSRVCVCVNIVPRYTFNLKTEDILAGPHIFKGLSLKVEVSV